MTPKQKPELRMSEVRSKLNALGGEENPSEDQLTEIRTLTEEYRQLETRSQAFIVAGDEGDGEGTETRTETTNASDKLAGLERRASIGEIMHATLHKGQTTGAERELQTELGLGDNQVPIALLRRGEADELETRAVTPAPGNVGQNQQPIIPAVFPQSAHAFLGIPTPTVGVGEAVYPVLTTSAAPVAAAKGASVYAHASIIYLTYAQGGAAISALDDLAMRTGGVRVSAHVPAKTASHRQNAIVRRGMRRDAVAPIWEGITLIPDEITRAATGEILVTAVMLYAFKILRTDGFFKQQIQVEA